MRAKAVGRRRSSPSNPIDPTHAEQQLCAARTSSTASGSAAAPRNAEHQSVQPGRRRRRVRAGERRAGEGGDRQRATRIPEVVAEQHPAARRHPRCDRQRDPRAQGGARHAALARGRQDASRKGIGEAARAGYIFKFFAGEALRGNGELVPSVRPGLRRRDHARAGRRRRHDHAVELPDRDSRVEDRAGARLRQLRRVQAGGPRARLRVGAGRDHLAHRPAPRRVQSRHGTRLGRRRCVRQLARRRCDQLHRLGADRQGDRAHGDRDDEEAAARDGRQESAGRARRRQPRRRGQCVAAERVLLDRPALHGLVAAHRHRGHPRPLRRTR